MERAAPIFVEVTAGGADDPDGVQAGTLLSAYFHAEHMRTMRRLLWHRLGVFSALWFVVSFTTLFSRPAIVVGFCIFGGLACWIAWVEWNAERRLKALIDRKPPSSASLLA